MADQEKCYLSRRFSGVSASLRRLSRRHTVKNEKLLKYAFLRIREGKDWRRKEEAVNSKDCPLKQRSRGQQDYFNRESFNNKDCPLKQRSRGQQEDYFN